MNDESIFSLDSHLILYHVISSRALISIPSCWDLGKKDHVSIMYLEGR